jgi:hypothetical protein
MRSLLSISRRLGNSDGEVSVVLILNYRGFRKRNLQESSCDRTEV